jgi:AcrR family transcriptional regulator
VIGLGLTIPTSPRDKFKAGADLRRRLLVTASRLFQERGYENVSIRSIAQEVGCSQMAMYRHFPDKDALIRHLCTEIYQQFTAGVRTRLGNLTNPSERLRQSLRYFLLLAMKNPHHYRFTFLLPTTDEKALKMRSEVAEPAIEYLRANLRLVLPEGSSSQLVDRRLHELLATVHGLAVMLITYPKVYKLTRETALKRMDDALELFLWLPDRGKPRTRSI